LSSTAAALWNCSEKTRTLLGFSVGRAKRHRQKWTKATSPCGGTARRGATLGCAYPLAPLRLSFGPRPSSKKNRSFGFYFVQFWEYFLCSFSETQK
jgi:hypothetical protein